MYVFMYHATNTITALKDTQSLNQWPNLIPASSNKILPKRRSVLLLCHLTDDSTIIITKKAAANLHIIFIVINDICLTNTMVWTEMGF